MFWSLEFVTLELTLLNPALKAQNVRLVDSTLQFENV